ncbi:GMC family oxidoreductase [Emcibacter nanhaiensis]|uniref:GMC family oxidoreductase n=1 Tax=Emcibacter nanhaiensis TaxID=1505037 RepID=A0A501PF68_9PROT|nr:GMC family oxidoreductase [Emcibacter nanhaiensis]TPD59070.1 GMC family oxidoreductase [Emcibacter nanhaiensis]
MSKPHNQEKVDVVIVGSGAAGSLMAAKLAEAGKKVVILEAGPERKLTDLVSSGLNARRLKWAGSPVEQSGSHTVGNGFNSGFGTGGAALHHYAVWPRFHAEDFDMQSRYGKGLDWPVSYDELRPWYDRIQTEVGISGDAEQEVWRPAGDPYPMGPVPTFGQGEVIARGFDKLGRKTAPLPLAINTENYHGREACIWDGWCDAGCPIRALANPQTVYLPRAFAKGAEIRHRATVFHIDTDTKGGKATGVSYYDEQGQENFQPAELVVLAAFAVQTPRLMLMSTSDKHPHGIANKNDMVGRYLMSHAAGLVFGLFDEETQCYLGATGGQLVNQDNYDHKDKRGQGFGSYQWMIAQATKPNDLLGYGGSNPALFGNKLTDFMKKATRGFATMTACVEDLPVAENRVTLSSSKDGHGLPRAHAHHDMHPDSIALWKDSQVDGTRVFEAAGAGEIWTNNPPGAMHIMGGTIMGEDSATSVTNSFGQTHEVPNLVIAGPGLFPTSGGVNPTFTVHAVTLRSADHIIRNWSSLT